MGARHRSAKTNARSDKLPINRRDKHLDNRACISEWHASHHRRTQYNIIRSYIHTHTRYVLSSCSTGLQIIHDYLVTWPNTSRRGRFLLFRIKYSRQIRRAAGQLPRSNVCVVYILTSIRAYIFINRESRSSARTEAALFIWPITLGGGGGGKFTARFSATTRNQDHRSFFFSSRSLYPMTSGLVNQKSALVARFLTIIRFSISLEGIACNLMQRRF